MKFHAAILVPDGRVKAKECRDGDKLGRDPINRRMMAEFQALLREHLTDDSVKIGKFRAKFGDIRHILEWQQVEPLSAMGKFYVRGRFVAASFYLHGFVPEMDEAVLEATEVLFESWFDGARNARPASRALRSIKERPVAVVMPGSKRQLDPADWHIIGNLCPCLAAVFFARAEAFIKKVDEFGQALGLRKMGHAPDPLRN